MAILRERVEAMKAIWTQDEASYAGEHVAFERIWSYTASSTWFRAVVRAWNPSVPFLLSGRLAVPSG